MYLDPGTGTSVSSGLRQPSAHPLSLTHYAFPSPTPPSVLRNIQHSPPSPDCCCLPIAEEIKGGGMEKDKIFSKLGNRRCTVVVEIEPAPPVSTLAGLPLSLNCIVILHCTAKLTGFIIGLWQILDSSSQCQVTITPSKSWATRNTQRQHSDLVSVGPQTHKFSHLGANKYQKFFLSNKG